MAKIERVIKSEIMRLAKRQVKTAFMPLKREVRQMSVKLSGLSKGIASLNRLTKELRLEEATPTMEATPEEVKSARITPGRISGLRKKLNLSQRKLGILTGASLSAVLAWEKGKFSPKGDKRAALVALRKMKKRDVKRMLEQKAQVQEKPGRKAKAKRRGGKRVVRGQKRGTRQRKFGPKKSRK